METEKQGSLETKVRQAREADRPVELISNMNDLRVNQLMKGLVDADKEARFLKTGQIVLIERNHNYLEEIMDHVLPELCPSYLITYEDHHMPHHVVYDGKVTMYQNLDQNSDVAFVLARVKHPCSINEKVGRKHAQHKRVSTLHDRRKVNTRDTYGINLVCTDAEAVERVGQKISKMPFLSIEKIEAHRQGYTSDHYNVRYHNGNPFLTGLEVEIQVTDLQSHYESIHDPVQAHDEAYKMRIMQQPRKSVGQLVIVGNSITLPDELSRVETSQYIIVPEVPSSIQRYTLVIPKH
jgi:ppGpp synthetase/RelA/SpoT-type nucleotidyltranferase